MTCAFDAPRVRAVWTSSSGTARIAETTTGLIRPELTVAQRAAEVVRLTQLAEQSDRVEGAIPGLRMNLESAEADLAAYEHQLASRPMLARVAAR